MPTNDPRTYSSWYSAKRRCTNPAHKDYNRYGGAGVTMCDRWMNSFAAFFEDMGLRPEGKTLDRYPDPHGNYEPGNCRWATQSEQMNNTRRGKGTSKPKPQIIRNPRKCFECGTEFQPKKSTGTVPKFCCIQHQQAWQRRQAYQGRTVIALTKAWVASLGQNNATLTNQLLRELKAAIEPLNRDDIDAGRADPITYVEHLLGNSIDTSSRKK